MAAPRTPSRVIILGHTGFIGGNLIRSLNTCNPDVEVIGISKADIDLEDDSAPPRLARMFDAHSAVVMCAAIKRQSGDTPRSFLRNVAMVTHLCEAVAISPPGRLLFLSSAAVYGEDIENPAITEATALHPRSHYGLSKLAGEWILSRTFERFPDSSLVLLRPATIYGPNDHVASYGPLGFIRSALRREAVKLWGDGSEFRELILIDDAVELIRRILFLSHSGPINLVSGRSYSFREILQSVEKCIGRDIPTTSMPRTKNKVDNIFHNGLLTSLVPGFCFTPLAEGVRLTIARDRHPGESAQ